MNSKTFKVLVPVVTFLIGAVLGPGFLWQWRHSGIETQQHELEKTMKEEDLRKAEIDQYAALMNMSNEYIKVRDENAKASTPTLSMRIWQLNDQMNIAVGNLRDTEAKLARLEERPPRAIHITLPNIEVPSGLHGAAH